MTREEAKDILQKVVNWKYDSLRGHPSINSIAEAAEIILQNNLSTDINEAAEEWFKYAKYKSDLSWTPINAFKAGAEWMAGQGETLYDTINVDGKNQRWLGENLLYGDYNAGQAVIVQIRKV